MDKTMLIIYICILINLVVVLAGVLIFFAVKTGRLSKEIEQLQASCQAALENSMTDELTGLLKSRCKVVERLSQEIARAKRFGDSIQIIFIDLDNFSSVNNTLGHNVGDLTLKTAAAIIKGCLRDYDIVARWGGDEFVAVLPQTSKQLCLRAAEKILEEISGMVIGAGSVGISASIGVYQFDPDNPLDPIEAADAAMYAAKHGGKGKISVAPTL